MSDSLTAQTIRLAGHGEDEIEAYLVTTPEPATRGGVVVIHHLPGYDRGTKEIARRFADLGYDAIVPNLYSREGFDVSPDDAAAAARAKGGVPDAQFIGDVDACTAHLRAQSGASGKVGVIGYCSGGRHAVLAACNVDLNAAVDCYGAFVTGIPPEGFPLKVTNLVDQLPNLRCPLLGLFGNDDQYPSPEHVDELETRLTELGKPHEFHRYDGAGHAFFSIDRPAYRPESAVDGWERITQFFGQHLA